MTDYIELKSKVILLPRKVLVNELLVNELKVGKSFELREGLKVVGEETIEQIRRVLKRKKERTNGIPN